MIGKICTSVFPFYDMVTRKTTYKVRPILIIGTPDTGDYNILPISKITRAENRNPIYDIKVIPAMYPLLNLRDVSYIRTHKQSYVHHTSINATIGDLKAAYEDLYLAVLEKLEQYNSELLGSAL
jgi:hypothetical protein